MRLTTTGLALLALAAGCHREDADASQEACELVWHLDADLDGYGGNLVVLEGLCEAPGEHWYPTGEDCDDLDPEVAPLLRFYEDEDGDGWGVTEWWVEPTDCQKPPSHAERPGDCDDTDPGLHPATRWYSDLDGDGHGSELNVVVGCEEVEGHVLNHADCDDLDASVHPGADEVCGGKDEDCDGLVDEEDPDLDPSTLTAWYWDEDGDGHAGEDLVLWSCEAPTGWLAEATDCDDDDASVSPHEAEVCGNGVDDDCSGDGAGCRWEGTHDLAVDADLVHTGPTDVEDLGAALAVADLDGDGADEVLVSGWTPGEEITYETVSTSDEIGLTWVLAEAGSGDLDLEEDAVAAWYAEADMCHYGAWAVVGGQLAGLGDLDGDGTEEVYLSYHDDHPTGRAAYAGACSSTPTGALVYGEEEMLSGESSLWDEDPFLPGLPAAVGDLDGDDLAEIVIFSSDESHLFYGASDPLSGSVSLDEADAVVVDEGYHHCTGLRPAGDLDGDGLSDLADGCGDGDVVRLFYGDSTRFSGTYTAEDAAHAAIGSMNPTGNLGHQVGGGDLTGDGYADLVVTESSDAVILVDGGATRFSGSLTAEHLTYASVTCVEAVGYLGEDMIFADLDADGHGDALLSDGETVWVVYGPVDVGPHALEDLPSASFSGTTLGAWDAGNLDEDADAYLDIVFGAPDDGALYLFVGTGM